MSDLISTPPSPASPVDSKVTVDGWFPDIDVNALRKTVRIGENIVPHERLVAAIEGAILTALRNLALWRSAHATAGVAELAEVPDDVEINGQPRTVILWHRIIRHYTAAQVADEYRDLIATDQQVQRSDEERITGDQHRRLGHNAVADLQSIGADTPVLRNSVELI
ncbi:MAG: hypothetical protein A2792_00070 [Sphingomonadales bacterium RIFCSPHIGHO2_01_FULL_65_20]|nr:MAG: hypothetical protein A2792_00070 [Sphingomonadales bacterium RIFCSPHIGHO2_01_FULL_65_20]